MGERRRAAFILLFFLATALFNWPLAGLFLEAGLFSAFAGLFIALSLLAAALYLVAGKPPGGESARPSRRGG